VHVNDFKNEKKKKEKQTDQRGSVK